MIRQKKRKNIILVGCYFTALGSQEPSGGKELSDDFSWAGNYDL